MTSPAAYARCAFAPPLAPMLAKLSHALPEGDGWLFEPKWDGFRALVFRGSDEVFLQSRDGKPLGRYFPEVTAALAAQLPEGCVLDGELVVVRDSRLDFEALQLRLHPAASRVALLSSELPAAFVAFDLLSLAGEDLRPLPQRERRAKLEALLVGVRAPVHLTPATRDRSVAEDWFRRFEGAGLDGVVAKPESLVYTPDKRVMLKVKHQRTADCVVAGFRWFKGGEEARVGSLLLGLYDHDGHLQSVGVCASFKRAERAALTEQLRPLRDGAAAEHPWRVWATGSFASRWNPEKALSWEPIRLGPVVEVSYDHLQGQRFRHSTHLVRWRPDKSPADCRFDQLEATPPAELAELFGPPRALTPEGGGPSPG